MLVQDVIGWETHLAYRIAARYGFRFYISRGLLSERGEYNEESREPTPHEEDAWAQIPEEFRRIVDDMYLNPASPPTLDATVDELCSAINAHHAVIYLNAKDFATFRSRPPIDDFEVMTHRELLLTGLFATTGTTRIYVSREIPVGYFLPSTDRIEALTPIGRRPGEPRKVVPPMDERAKYELLFRLEPLMVKQHLLSTTRRAPPPPLFNVRITRTPNKVEGDKRTYAPYVTTWTCPDCKTDDEIDHRSEYFNYPVYGEPVKVSLYCEKCDSEKGSIHLVVDLVVRQA